MSFSLSIPVKESLKELRMLLKKSQPIFVPRLRMLIEMKKEGEIGISKRELMSRIGASSQSIHNWRTVYKNEGIEALLSHNKKGFKSSVFSKDEHDRLSAILHDANNELTGFVELREWVKTEFGKEVKYNTLLKYCIHNFGAKTKVARKSHVKKDDAKVVDFKKTLIISAKKPLKK